MAIKITNFGGTDWEDGNTLFSADLIDTIEHVLDMEGTNFKNNAQLIYNSAYIGFNSNLNLNTGVPNFKNIKYDVFQTDTATTKTGWRYDSVNKYYFPNYTDQAPGDTTHNIDSMTNPANAFDGNDTTFAQKTATASLTVRIGKTFTAKHVTWVRVKNYRFCSNNGGSPLTQTMLIESFNGSVWSTEYTGTGGVRVGNFITVDEDILYYLNKSVSGLRVNISTGIGGNTPYSSDLRVYSFEYGNATPSNSLIFQTTSLPIIRDCIPTWNSEIDSDNTLTVSISADGTNYEEVNDATFHKFSDTGTNLYVKFEVNRIDNTANDKISEYGILYNLGAT